jgi:hypothetical protein
VSARYLRGICAVSERGVGEVLGGVGGEVLGGKVLFLLLS